MLESFRSNISKNKLFAKTDKLLLAFSGGIDSVVLAMLLKEAGYDFELAHCNFKLRGKESDTDEKFCKDFAKKINIKIHSHQFKTKEYVKKTKLSVQMAARELRYNWFMDLVKKNKYKYVLTAHHANDAIETLLINLVRGTGINGLQGIPQKQNLIVRPLLFATKSEIQTYAKKNKLIFRNDSSNDEVKYKRNFLRHEIIPGLKKLNPSLENTFENNIRLFKQTASVLKQFISEKKKLIVTGDKNDLKIDLKKLLKEESAELLLFEWLHPLDFNASQAEQIFTALDIKSSGKLFFSPTHKALIDRDHIFVELLEPKTSKSEYILNGIADFKKLPFALEANLSIDKKIISGKNIAQIDFQKSLFPMKLRKWQQGDRFMPLGMEGFKKISDFLINQKLSRFEKENIWLLLNKNEVVWVVGQRLDERYKINSKTKKILKLQLKEV